MKFRLRNLIFTGLLVAIGIILSQLLSFYYPPSTSIFKFGIGYVPLIIISILFGPEIGLFAGISQDVIGYFLMGSARGVFYFGFTFNAILYGVLPSLIVRIKGKASPMIFYVFNNIIVSLIILASIIYLIDITLISSSSDFSDIYRYVITSIGLVSSLILLWISIRHHQKNNTPNNFHMIFFIVLVLYVVVSLVLTPIWLSDLYSISVWALLPVRIIKMPVEVLLYTVILDKLLTVLEKEMNTL